MILCARWRLAPMGKRIASGSFSDDTIKLWDTDTGTEVITLYPKGVEAGISFVGFTPDGRQLLSVTNDGRFIRYASNRD